MLQIFYAPSLTALIIRNLFFAIFYLKFIEPLLISKKIRQRLFFMLFFFSFFFIANYWYNQYFGNFLSVSDIFSGEGTGDFSMYQVLFTQIFRFRDIVIILDMALLGLWGFNSLPDLKITYDWGFWKRSLSRLPLKNTTAFALIFVLLLVQVVAGSYIMGGESPSELYQSGTSYLASVYGILPLYTIEAYSYFTREEEKPRPELKNVPYYRKQTQLSGIKSLPKNTNVILIQVESLDAAIIDYRQQGKEVTPFLNQLKEQSYYFENF
jgi:phosphoglycerol transferase MdoB-like AlkP superfamily enzyme